jgi:hypothetical protein
MRSRTSQGVAEFEKKFKTATKLWQNLKLI